MSVTPSLLRAFAPLALLSWLTLSPRDARSQTPAPAPSPSPPGETGASETVSPPSAEPDKKKKKKDKEAEAAAAAAAGATPGMAFATSDGGRTTKLLDGRLELKGRVFARAAYVRSDTRLPGVTTPVPEGMDLSVASARFGIKYEVLDFASLVIEADVGDKPLLRDGFIQARSKRLRGRIGQFKMPISSITLDSPWSLPMARRGNLQTVLAERLFLAGRRPGASFAVRGGGWLDPELTVGIFQGAYLDGNFDEELFKLQGLDRHNLVARLSATPSGVDVGLVATRTTVLAFQRIGHYWAAGPDATFEIPFAGHAMRGWFEAFVGNMEHSREPTPGVFEYYKANFWLARAIAAWRLGGMEDGEWYLEPFVLAGGFDPDTTAPTDLFMETFVGVNVGWWRRLRVTLQYEMASAADLMPGFIFPGNLAPRSHNAVLLQVGAAF